MIIVVVDGEISRDSGYHTEYRTMAAQSVQFEGLRKVLRWIISAQYIGFVGLAAVCERNMDAQH